MGWQDEKPIPGQLAFTLTDFLTDLENDRVRPVNPPLRLLAVFQEVCALAPDWLLTVPGREMWVAAHVEPTQKYAVYAPDVAGRVVFDIRSARQGLTYIHRPLPRWARYVAGVAVVMHDEGWALPGATVVIAGEEPSGPRYEHALGMGFAALWHAYHERPCADRVLIELLDRVPRV